MLAVADGVIAIAVDGKPDNAPGHVPPLDPASPECQICGNHVVLEMDQGHFATYMHLQSNSLRVTTGDRVGRGQVLGWSAIPENHFNRICTFMSQPRPA